MVRRRILTAEAHSALHVRWGKGAGRQLIANLVGCAWERNVSCLHVMRWRGTQSGWCGQATPGTTHRVTRLPMHKSVAKLVWPTTTVWPAGFMKRRTSACMSLDLSREALGDATTPTQRPIQCDGTLRSWTQYNAFRPMLEVVTDCCVCSQSAWRRGCKIASVKHLLAIQELCWITSQ